MEVPSVTRVRLWRFMFQLLMPGERSVLRPRLPTRGTLAEAPMMKAGLTMNSARGLYHSPSTRGASSRST